MSVAEIKVGEIVAVIGRDGQLIETGTITSVDVRYFVSIVIDGGKLYELRSYADDCPLVLKAEAYFDQTVSPKELSDYTDVVHRKVTYWSRSMSAEKRQIVIDKLRELDAMFDDADSKDMSVGYRSYQSHWGNTDLSLPDIRRGLLVGNMRSLLEQQSKNTSLLRQTKLPL